MEIDWADNGSVHGTARIAGQFLVKGSFVSITESQTAVNLPGNQTHTRIRSIPPPTQCAGNLATMVEKPFFPPDVDLNTVTNIVVVSRQSEAAEVGDGTTGAGDGIEVTEVAERRRRLDGERGGPMGVRSRTLCSFFCRIESSQVGSGWYGSPGYRSEIRNQGERSTNKTAHTYCMICVEQTFPVHLLKVAHSHLDICFPIRQLES